MSERTNNVLARIKLGTTVEGSHVYNNPSQGSGDMIGICGEHGTGKSSLTKSLTLEYSRAGIPVLVLDPIGTFNASRLVSTSKLDVEFKDTINLVNATSDGIPCGLLHGYANNSSVSREYYSLFIKHSFGVFNCSKKCTNAITPLLDTEKVHKQMMEKGFIAWKETILSSTSSLSEEVANEALKCMAPLFSDSFLLPEQPTFTPGSITLYDLSGAGLTNVWRLAEMLLIDIWLNAQQGKYHDTGLLIAIDEAHNAYLEPQGAISSILKEGRKQGIGLILATQDFRRPKLFHDAFNNCDLKLYLRQSLPNAKHLAKQLTPKDITNMTSRFSSLPIGSYYIEGCKELDGMNLTEGLLKAHLEI
jgi:hypothetical protein